MIPTKYLIIIGIIICLLVLYYFYSEIAKMKKSFIPAYQKTMSLESKILGIEKQINSACKRKMITNKLNSPVYSISYQSDMLKNGNLSVKYADITETEAKELLQNIEKNKKNSQKHNKLDEGSFSSPPGRFISGIKPSKISDGDFAVGGAAEHRQNTKDLSEFDSVFNNGSQITSDVRKVNFVKDDLYTDKSEIINVDLSRIINKKPQDIILFDTNDNIAEYQDILNNLTRDVSNMCSPPKDDFFTSDCIDQDIVKNISESIHFADLPSDTILSDIPTSDIKKTNKELKYNAKNNKKKSFNQ